MGKVNRWKKKSHSAFKTDPLGKETSDCDGDKIMKELALKIKTARKLVSREKGKALQRAAAIVENSSSVPMIESETTPDKDYQELPCSDKADPVLGLYSSEVWKSIVHKRDNDKWSYHRLAHQYKLLRNSTYARIYIGRKRAQIRLDKKLRSRENYDFIDEEVWKIVKDMDKHFESIHDSTICQVAKQEARKIDFSAFKASSSWLISFKKKHNLGSRHVDLFVSSKKLEDMEKLNETVAEFRKTTWPSLWRKFGEKKVFNVDQTGLKLELTSLRTLTVKGKRKVYRKIQRASAIGHSITVHIAISADGKVFPKTLIVLHEKKLPKKFE